jgi:hypothetical protein
MHANPMITNIRAKQSANSEIRNVLYPIHEIKTMIVRDKHTCIYSQLEAHCLNALVVQKYPASHIQHHITKLFLATIDNLFGCVIRTPTLCRSAAPLDENKVHTRMRKPSTSLFRLGGMYLVRNTTCTSRGI